MNALKTSTLLRPSSRPSSPAPGPPSRPDSGVGFDRVARPLNKLSLSNFRRPSPAPAGAALPAQATPLVQDGSYLEMLSLKLSEAVSKALAQAAGPVNPNEQVSGRKPIPAGRGKVLGDLIASEVNAAKANAHLSKAIIRTLARPLSVLLTNLSSQLSPLLSAPAFTSTSAPTVQNPNYNATQLHAIGIANFAGELVETFEELGLGLDYDARGAGDGLKAVREGLVSIVNRAISPLFSGIRNELTRIVDSLESPATTGFAKNSSSGKAHGPVNLNPAVVTLQGVVPVYAKALARLSTTTSSQKALASLLISVVWRAMVALSHRPHSLPTPPPSPSPTPTKKRDNSFSTTTPPMTPPSGRFNLKSLPPSRPPSPPEQALKCNAALDAKVVYGLLNQLPRPTHPVHDLAREAVDEGFNGMKALSAFLEAAHSISVTEDTEKRLVELGRDIPTLICLPALLHGVSVAGILGITEEAYRQGCLSGFGRADECADAVGQRVLDVLQAKPGTPPSIIKFLEMELEASDDEMDL